ncbi:MAG: hypothetical protein Q7T71_19680, partial [Herbiconiux sp.]|nr:hypothetical protein [Herbiconiux sp.]
MTALPLPPEAPLTRRALRDRERAAAHRAGASDPAQATAAPASPSADSPNSPAASAAPASATSTPAPAKPALSRGRRARPEPENLTDVSSPAITRSAAEVQTLPLTRRELRGRPPRAAETLRSAPASPADATEP